MNALGVLILFGAVSAAAGFVYCTFRMAREINRAEGKQAVSAFLLFGFFPLLARHARLVPDSRIRVLYVVLGPVIFVLVILFMMARPH
jgi:hypothetical protein